MKKIDKLILGSFLGPFILTFLVVIFILLMQFMLRYFNEIVGKDLGYDVVAQLIFYFSIFMTPNAFPLAVLLSSLMTFGNLGEHFELIAIKSAGISLIRTLVPIFAFTVILAFTAYYSNNYIVPKAALKAFSLLYDVKQKKPSMEIKEGAFYNGIDGYSFKINKKFPDGETLKDIIIYDHTKGQGNRDIILADSGRMYNILNNRYLVLELFDGYSYSEQVSSKQRMVSYIKRAPGPFIRTKFSKSKIVFSLASFDLKRTREDLFAGNRLMKSARELRIDIDSLEDKQLDMIEEIQDNSVRFFSYHLEEMVKKMKERQAEREALFQARNEIEDMHDSIANREKASTSKVGINDTLSASLAIADSLVKTDTVPDLSKKDTIERAVVIDTVGTKNAVITTKSKAGDPGKKKRRIDFAKTKYPYKKLLSVNKDSVRAKKFAKQKSSKEMTRSDSATTIIRLQSSVSISDTLSYEDRISIIDSLFATKKYIRIAITKALSQTRHVNNHMSVQTNSLERVDVETNKFKVEFYKKLSMSFTILIMFFIGAPLGAIIKRGGLGMPVLISIAFFILFYVLSMISEKWARQGVMDPFLAAWMANIILFPVGMMFMYQAKNDARILEVDFYVIMVEKLKFKFSKFIKTTAK